VPFIYPSEGERRRGKRGCSPRSGSRKLNECGWYPGSVTHLGARWPGEVPPGAQGLPRGVAHRGVRDQARSLRDVPPLDRELEIAEMPLEREQERIRKTGSQYGSNMGSRWLGLHPPHLEGGNDDVMGA
jgi:hypothetical protein